MPKGRGFTANPDKEKVIVSDLPDMGGKDIIIPSAMWPLNGKTGIVLSHDNTVPCKDDGIRSVFDGMQFTVGGCYHNAFILREALRNAGYQLTLMLDGYSWEIRFLPIIVSSSSMRTPYWTRLLSTTEKWRLINWTREKLLWTSSSPCRTSPKAVTPLSGKSCPE